MARKSPADKIRQIRRVISAWERLAPDAVFYGMTLAQFRAAVQPSIDTRDQIDDHMRHVKLLTGQRDFVDVEAMRLVEGVSLAVQGNPKFGQDSLLYGQMGYVRKSARRKRRSKQAVRARSRGASR